MAEGETKRALIVDDDMSVLRLIREALQNILHWEVDTSPKPEYGFELALKKTYDLMIFDFSMPMIDGALLFELISKVYENSSPPRRMPPLLLVSGQGSDERARELRREARVCGFLPKPFTINRLLEKVKESVPDSRAIA
jgi:DNA-binding response OmpR family regulator